MENVYGIKTDASTEQFWEHFINFYLIKSVLYVCIKV